MSRFQTTRWSLIEAARAQPLQARPALDALCEAYRPPVLAFIRRHGYAEADAQDLTQAFFLRFIERGWYAEADPLRGRFRALLLTALRNFLDDQRDRGRTLKRGGGAGHANEALDALADADNTPEAAFTRSWLRTVVGHAMDRLEREWEQAGKRVQFDQLAPLLLERGDGEALHALADATGLRANTLAVQAHRLRQRLRQLVRLELLQTVSTEEALEAELSELRGVLDEAA